MAKKKRSRLLLTEHEKEVTEQTNNYIALCFSMCEMMSWNEMATTADLSKSTLHSLMKVGFRPGTHYLTIQKLGRAAGLEMYWDGKRPKLKLVS